MVWCESTTVWYDGLMRRSDATVWCDGLVRRSGATVRRSGVLNLRTLGPSHWTIAPSDWTSHRRTLAPSNRMIA